MTQEVKKTSEQPKVDPTPPRFEKYSLQDIGDEARRLYHSKPQWEREANAQNFYPYFK